MLLNPSAPESSNARSASSSWGGVAVLAELAVAARSLPKSLLGVLWLDSAITCGGIGDAELDFLALVPKENVRLEPRNEKPGLVGGLGGTGVSWKGRWVDDLQLISDRASVEEGIVEEELRRAEDAALPYGVFEERVDEFSVPPLPLPN